MREEAARAFAWALHIRARRCLLIDERSGRAVAQGPGAVQFAASRVIGMSPRRRHLTRQARACCPQLH